MGCWPAAGRRLGWRHEWHGEHGQETPQSSFPYSAPSLFCSDLNPVTAQVRWRRTVVEVDASLLEVWFDGSLSISECCSPERRAGGPAAPIHNRSISRRCRVTPGPVGPIVRWSKGFVGKA